MVSHICYFPSILQWDDPKMSVLCFRGSGLNQLRGTSGDVLPCRLLGPGAEWCPYRVVLYPSANPNGPNALERSTVYAQLMSMFPSFVTSLSLFVAHINLHFFVQSQVLCSRACCQTPIIFVASMA